MMLGEMLAAARRSTSGVERWLGDADPELAARLREAASEEGETPSAFLRIAVADFERFASEEDWATLTSRVRGGGAEPGTAGLVAMLEWRFAQADQAPRP